MEMVKISSEIQELSFEDTININGGESLWYWVSYGIGATIHGLAVFAKEGGRNAGISVR